MHHEQEAFLRAIKADPYDEVTRRVYADWLEEHGMDDEALVQRRWTREYQESVDWMTGFAERAGLDYEDVIAAARDFAETGIYYVQFGSQSAQDEMWNSRQEFWEHWQRITGESVDEDRQGTVFSCSC